jgi:hypothetical protein
MMFVVFGVDIDGYNFLAVPNTRAVSINVPLPLPPFPSCPGIHPTIIASSFQKAANKAVEILRAMSTPVNLDDRETLLKSANTSLNSKVRCVIGSNQMNIPNNRKFAILMYFLRGYVKLHVCPRVSVAVRPGSSSVAVVVVVVVVLHAMGCIPTRLQ